MASQLNPRLLKVIAEIVDRPFIVSFYLQISENERARTDLSKRW